MSETLQVESIDGGVLLPVRVVPRASRTEVDGIHDGALRVRLKAPPVEGAANKELCAFLAKTLGVSSRQLEIRAGQRNRNKRIAISGLSPADVTRALSGLRT